MPALPCEALAAETLRAPLTWSGPPCWRCTWLIRPDPLLTVLHHDVLRLLQPSLHLLTRCLVVSGHHSTNSALCWSTGRRNQWSLPCLFVAGPGLAPASTSSSAHSSDSSRDSSQTFCVDTSCRLVSLFTWRLSCLAGIFIVSLHLLTHLELPVEVCCSSSILTIDSSRASSSRLAAVAPSSLTQAVLCSTHCLCLSRQSLRAAWAAADP